MRVLLEGGQWRILADRGVQRNQCPRQGLPLLPVLGSSAVTILDKPVDRSLSSPRRLTILGL